MRAANALCRALAILCTCALSINAQANNVNFGYTGPLSGPNEAVGQQILNGIELGFKRINGQNVLPYTLSVIGADDGYEPQRTVPIIQEMADKNNLIGLIGSVGTPTTVAAVPTLKALQLPLIYPLTGSSFLRSEELQTLIFTARASYHDEAQLLAKTVAGKFNIAPKDMAIYIQQDSYGELTLRSLTNALKEYGLEHSDDIMQIHYLRNQPSADEAVAKLLARKEQPKAIFLISTYAAAAELITLLDKVGVHPLFAGFSFVSHEAINQRLAGTQVQLLSTQLHPCVEQNDDPIIQDFKQDIERYGNPETTTTLELEGYLAARYVERILLQYGTEEAPTRAEFLSYLREYNRLHKDQQNAVAKENNLGQNQYPIWLELQNYKTQESFCGQQLPPEFLRGEL